MPPAVKKELMAALSAAAESAAMNAGVLSQPPQLVTDATAIALNLVGSNRVGTIAPAVLMFVKETPKAVNALVNSVPWSNVSTGKLGLAEPARAKLISAARARPAEPPGPGFSPK